MNALVKKEIRLLLPAWVTAMLVVFAPIPIGLVIEGNCLSEITAVRTAFAVAMAGVILGLAGFGREVSARTFSLLLAQPRPRRELWRAKIGVLLIALIPLGLFLVLVHQIFVPHPMGSSAIRQTIALVWFLTACAAVTGGLWTTLLFRQLIAAFWISIIVPFAVFAVAMQPEDEHTRGILATVLLLVYSVGGYWFARWQFLRAQDTAWTGGDVSLPGIAKWLPWASKGAARKKSHPLLALVRKEFQFQQINFLLGGVLLLLQIAVLVTQKLITSDERTTLQAILEGFWGIWIVMPLLVGSGAVAEERKLGMLDTQLCLPVSRAWQFAVKVIVTLLCGTLLGAAVPVALAISHQIGPGQMDQGFLAGWPLCCACLALVAFYASSLTNQLLQALGAAIGILVVAMLVGSGLGGAFSGPDGQVTLFGLALWRGPLVLVIGACVLLAAAMVYSWRRLRRVWISVLALIVISLVWMNSQSVPAVLVAMQSEVLGVKTSMLVGWLLAFSPVALILVLAANNTNAIRTSLSLWGRNAAVWFGCLLLAGVINTLVYNRAWELFLRLEPPAGAARLNGSVKPAIVGIMPDLATLVLMPDGRVCTYQGYQRISVRVNTINADGESEPAWRALDHPRVEFLAHSNWVAFAATTHEAVGVKSDGSMWRAPLFDRIEKSTQTTSFVTGAAHDRSPKRPVKQLQLTKLDESRDWKTVVASWNHFVALKSDGSIWGWGARENGQLGEGAKFSTNTPLQISTESDWVAAFATPGHTFAVNRAGEIWKWGQFQTDMWGKKSQKGPVKLNLKVPGVREIISANNCDLILDTDGRLWGFGRLQPALLPGSPPEDLYAKAQPLRGENWSAISANWQGLVALKNDGTLWRQPWEHRFDRGVPPLTQVGERSDWIAVVKEWDAVLALAKDGTICRFGVAMNSNMQLLAPTRRVTWSLNLLDAAK